MAVDALPETCPRTSTLWVRAGSAAYLGAPLGLAPHSTSVHCVVVGVDAPLVVDVDGRTLVARSVLVPPRTVHHVTTEASRVLFAYADVTRAGAHYLELQMLRHDGALGVGHRDETRLIDLCSRSDAPGDEVMSVATGRGSDPLDPRIHRTVDRLLGSPHGSAASLAAAESLSRSYFLRLFGAETGTTFRRFRLWVRMLQAARSVSSGADLTTAAADAGFASPSHFSDSFVRMFGLSATALAATGATIHLDGPTG